MNEGMLVRGKEERIFRDVADDPDVLPKEHCFFTAFYASAEVDLTQCSESHGTG
jgi:hypothetical protein